MAEHGEQPESDMANLRLAVSLLQASHQADLDKLEKFIQVGLCFNTLPMEVADQMHEQLFNKFVEAFGNMDRMKQLIEAYKTDLDRHQEASKTFQKQMEEANSMAEKQSRNEYIREACIAWTTDREEFKKLFEMSHQAEENRNKACAEIEALDKGKAQDTITSSTKILEDLFKEFDLVADKRTKLTEQLSPLEQLLKQYPAEFANETV